MQLRSIAYSENIEKEQRNKKQSTSGEISVVRKSGAWRLHGVS